MLFIQELEKFKDTDFEEIDNLKNENMNLKFLVKSYEERNLTITELEKKIRSQQTKFESEIKDIKSVYKEKIMHLKRKIKKIEERNELVQKGHRIVTEDNKDINDRVNIMNNNRPIIKLLLSRIQK